MDLYQVAVALDGANGLVVGEIGPRLRPVQPTTPVRVYRCPYCKRRSLTCLRRPVCCFCGRQR